MYRSDLKTRDKGGAIAAVIAIHAVLLFVFMRAASFHHLDEWVTVKIGLMRSGWWLELAGIAVIALSAVAFRREQSP